MKKTTLLIAFLATTLITQAQIPNGDFETWQLDTVLTSPDGFIASDQILFNIENPLVQQSADAYQGDYALELNSDTLNGDTLGSFAILGNVVPGDDIQPIPYSSEVDTLKGFAKYDIQEGDTAVVFILIKYLGQELSVDGKIFKGKSNDWEEFSIPLSAGLLPRDSIIIVMQIGGDENSSAIPGSIITFDSLHFASSSLLFPQIDPIPNGNFENWSHRIAEVPESWASFNRELALLEVPPTIEKTMDSQSGFAAKVSTIEVMGDTLNGLFYLGQKIGEEFVGGAPYSGPLKGKVSGYLKSVPNGDDQAAMALNFMVGGEIISGDTLPIPNTAGGFIPFSIAFDLMGTPEEISMLFFGGDKPGSYLIVDELIVEEAVGIGELKRNTTVMLYPNPAVNELHISQSARVVQIFNAQGTLVMQLENYNSQESIDVSDLKSGAYMITLEGETTLNFQK